MSEDKEPKKKFARIPEPAGEAGGVCAGFAYYTKTPVWIWRVGIVLPMVLSYFLSIPYVIPVIIISYIVICLFAPKMKKVPDDYKEVTS